MTSKQARPPRDRVPAPLSRAPRTAQWPSGHRPLAQPSETQRPPAPLFLSCLAPAPHLTPAGVPSAGRVPAGDLALRHSLGRGRAEPRRWRGPRGGLGSRLRLPEPVAVTSPSSHCTVWAPRRNSCTYFRSCQSHPVALPLSAQPPDGPPSRPRPPARPSGVTLFCVTALRGMREDPDPMTSCLATQTFYILDAKEKVLLDTPTSCLCSRRPRRGCF